VNAERCEDFLERGAMAGSRVDEHAVQIEHDGTDSSSRNRAPHSRCVIYLLQDSPGILPINCLIRLSQQ
jgi:hypothetical protein